MDGFAYELHELHELHEIQIHRVPYDSEESEEGTAPNPGKASNHRNALTWTRHWQRSHQSWKLWFGRFLMISLSVLLFLFFSPALLALIPLATLIYCRMAMLASKQRKHTLLSITWYFVAASAWPFCTVWWLGPEGPTHVAGGYFAFWLAVVLSLCVYAIANWEDLIEANRKMHLNEMLDLQSDWAWGWYVVGVVVDWYFFSVMALQNSLPKFLSSLQHEVPNEFWPLFSILATGKAITPGYGYTSILVFNIVLAMFPALSLADWLGFRWEITWQIRRFGRQIPIHHHRLFLHFIAVLGLATNRMQRARRGRMERRGRPNFGFFRPERSLLGRAASVRCAFILLFHYQLYSSCSSSHFSN